MLVDLSYDLHIFGRRGCRNPKPRSGQSDIIRRHGLGITAFFVRNTVLAAWSPISYFRGKQYRPYHSLLFSTSDKIRCLSTPPPPHGLGHSSTPWYPQGICERWLAFFLGCPQKRQPLLTAPYNQGNTTQVAQQACFGQCRGLKTALRASFLPPVLRDGALAWV